MRHQHDVVELSVLNRRTMSVTCVLSVIWGEDKWARSPNPVSVNGYTLWPAATSFGVTRPRPS